MERTYPIRFTSTPLDISQREIAYPALVRYFSGSVEGVKPDLSTLFELGLFPDGNILALSLLDFQQVLNLMNPEENNLTGFGDGI